MSKMKIYYLVLFMLICSQVSFANNISIANVSLTSKNTSAGTDNAANFRFVQFDISWENSWRTSSAPNNWDAAWVFMKYRLNGTGDWKHANFNAGAGQTAPAGGVIDVPADGVGAFIYRSADGSGTFSLNAAQLRWNYGFNNVLDNDVVEIKLFAIEMVYVPQGSFNLGSTGTEDNGLTNGSWTSGASVRLNITSENALNIENTAGNLWATTGTISNPIGSVGVLPAAYPKGYASFYCMKYETSQKQYRDFLNLLSYTQQAGLMIIAPTSLPGSGVLRNTSPYYRNGLVIANSGINSSRPAVIACDLDRDGVFNEDNDGENIACNFLSFKQGIAYLDWSGLRPMTELEFQKSCRGTATNDYLNFFVINSSTAITNQPYTLVNSGRSDENISNLSNANFHYSSTKNTTVTEQGPFRTGIFASSTTSSFFQAGATPLGIMEMGGNLVEQVINLVANEGRAYDGLNGDGNLASNGLANVSNWPVGTSNPKAYGTKGGGWNSFLWTELRIADRSQIISGITTSTLENAGIRGVRRPN